MTKIYSTLDKISSLLKDQNQIGIILTDTVYGIVCRAQDPESVEKIYDIKKRDLNKPPVIIISNLEQIKELGIVLNANLELVIKQYWPGCNSLIFELKDPNFQKKFEYLHRGTNSFAIRLPEYSSNSELLDLINQTGPLATSSANLQGEPTITQISDLKIEITEQVNFIIDSDMCNSQSSNIYKIYSDAENNYLVTKIR